MTPPPDSPTPPTDTNTYSRIAPAPLPDAAATTPVRPPVQRVPRLPSTRVSAALAAGMLAIGVAVGAAIGPAPSASFAGGRIPLLLSAIAAGNAGHTSTNTAQPPPVTPQPTPAATSTAAAMSTSPARSTKSKTPSTAVVVASPTSSPDAAKAPTGAPGGSGKQKTLPPVTSVWLITVSGATFAQALAQPAAAPYIDSQLVHAGTLLSGWSSLAAVALASEAGLLAGAPPQNLDSIVQPPCPEGAAGEPCKPETAGALNSADEFLKATVPSIAASAAYRAHGLIVITFATIGNATASSLPAGSSTATLGSEPPAGVLLISPFARAGARASTAYDPTSPKQTLAGLLH